MDQNRVVGLKLELVLCSIPHAKELLPLPGIPWKSPWLLFAFPSNSCLLSQENGASMRVSKSQRGPNPAQSLGKSLGPVGSVESQDEAAPDGSIQALLHLGRTQQGWDPSPTPFPSSAGGVEPCFDNQRQGLAGSLGPPSSWHGNYGSYWCQLEVKL